VIALILGVFLWANPPRATHVERVLLAGWTPVVIAVVSMSAMWYAWGSLREIPVWRDEGAYLLQADLFAAGHWADPAPPMVRFFEQPHVLVTPVLASEYPPGHSLMLTPGVWLHAPGLIPILLLGLSGGLVFALTRDVVRGGLGPWAALLAWIGWIGLEGHDTWPRPSYLSEITTSALWLVGWWTLLRWRDRPRPAWLYLLALCLGLGAITRPLATLAYAIPVVAVVMITVPRRRLWSQLGYATAMGALVLGLIPLWSVRTTGDWRETPLALYAAQCRSRDTRGLDARSVPLTRSLQPEVACREPLFREPAPGHTLLDIPVDLVAQLNTFSTDVLSDWRSGLLPFLLIALVVMPIELACAAACCGLLVTAYANYPHDLRYTVRSMDAQAGVIALAAVGICASLALVGRRWLMRQDGETANEAASRFVGWCVMALVLAAAPLTMGGLRATRERHELAELPQQRFRALIDGLPARRAIVFVRPTPDSARGQTLIENYPPLAAARAWIVYDRGAEDERLLRLVPDRVPFVFDASSWELHPYSGPTQPPGPVTRVKPAGAAGARGAVGSRPM
jgi:hypothetical protein